MIEVKPYTPEMREQWNRLVENSKNGTFLFDRGFMEYHNDRFQDYSFCIFYKDELRAILPANKIDNEVWSHKGLTYGGLILHRDEKLERTIVYFRELLKRLYTAGNSRLYYKPVPSFYHVYPSGEEEYVLFLVKADLFRRDSALVVDQTNPAQYQTRRSRAIKKAQKIGIRVILDNKFEAFWNNILVPNLKMRFGVPPTHTLKEIQLLHSRFPDKIHQYNAYDLNGNLQAGTTVFNTGSVAHAQYISANEEGRKNGSLDFLFDFLIKHEYSNKRYFDFGVSNENEGRKINYGLLNWKEGFGGRAMSHNFFKINPENYHLLDSVISKKEILT